MNVRHRPDACATALADGGLEQREQSKGARYIQLLDQARCSGDWNAVPELVRKIRKHASERSCLAIVAESEYAVAQASKGHPTLGRGAEPSGLSRLIAPLTEAISKGKNNVEDEFQAQVCLAWVHWVLGEFALTISKSAAHLEQDVAQFDGTGKESTEWTRVCALKALYIKGSSLSKTGAPAKAIETFESAMPLLSGSTATSSAGSERRTWTELLLTQHCMLSREVQRGSAPLVDVDDALPAFRAWGAFWEHQPGLGISQSGGYAVQANVPRREVWKQYYITLSIAIQRTLTYPLLSNTSTPAPSSGKIQLYSELKRVEQKYEALLLKEVSFPRAEQASEEVEAWVDLVMHNWRILCGSSWQEDDLPPGGREAVSRNTLDIIYRAATKTFHSTPILRHLFTVHLAVAEFELAFKAFDTYLEIAKKGNDRVKKTGEVEQGLDNEETVIKTACECVQALCRFGSARTAEKARSLAQYIQQWIETRYPQRNSSYTVNGNGNSELMENTNLAGAKILAPAWRSIGTSQAQWARVTYNATSRPELQLQAVKSLRKSLAEEFDSKDDVEALFALGIVLAERREISAAIEVVKTALLPASTHSNSATDVTVNPKRFGRERSLIPLWHLLALLLSARQEFTTAARACEGAFEQFKDPKNLFGETELDGLYRSEHLNEAEVKSPNDKTTSRNKGVIDEMDDFERGCVLEVKMTQLVLIEVIEGPDVAVNASDELLSLFTRLFGDPLTLPSTAPKSNSSLPQSSAGTLRSLKDSVFASSRRSTQNSPEQQRGDWTGNEKGSLASRPQTSATGRVAGNAPIIQVTGENDGVNDNRRSVRHEKLQKRSGSLSREKGMGIGSFRSRSRSASGPPARNRISGTDEDRSAAAGSGRASSASYSIPPKLDTASSNREGLHISHENPNLEHSPPRPGTQQGPSISQSMFPKSEMHKTSDSSAQRGSGIPIISSEHAPTPVTRFGKDQSRRHRVGILIKVWLLIAGFYRRAELLEDAKGAVDEAYKLVENLETDISRDSTGKVSIADPGWGIGKSVEQLWGDVWSERGHLSIAQKSPYIALSDFENALVHYADHPAAVVGLSNILLDIYTEVLPALPSIPSLVLAGPTPMRSPSTTNTPSVATTPSNTTTLSTPIAIPKPWPLGLPPPKSSTMDVSSSSRDTSNDRPHIASSTALLDRLAARDRAYGLLSALTKLGSGWNYSEAWYALARAYEEGGQVDKAKEALWWCVELEEGRGVREWECVGVAGYVL